jgi:hypothetical protein
MTGVGQQKLWNATKRGSRRATVRT